ncbi:MAG: HAMP domain-containing histidine kinase [Roseburia sp.]|jgi:two-component system sensor kinase Ihk|nr:HAMP domain-containing histidine kinase [Roseburia sp.]
MKKLKLFPKTFFYTLTIMIFVMMIAHILIYLLAPKMGMVISTSDNIAEKITVDICEEKIVMQAIQKALPFSFICSLLISVICSLLFSKAIVAPIERISASTERMMKLDRAAACTIHSKDEIGLLAQNVNDLYSNFLSTIEHLEQEKDRVSEMERAKADFLRAASHELKTPVTALNATLENMILGVGKYQDYTAYLPECKDMVERLSKMIHEIIEISKRNGTTEQWATVDLSELLEELCEPYQLIAAAHNISFSLDLPETFTMTLPINSFSKAVSNVLANAVAYTETGKTVTVFMDGRSLMIENECVPIQSSEIPRLFEPFYRPDFSRNRENGGNGLGLYIVDALLTSINVSYSFIPMKNPPGMCFTFQF